MTESSKIRQVDDIVRAGQVTIFCEIEGGERVQAMTLEDLGNLGDFIGGAAVLATLIYIALQIRLNTGALQSSGISDYRERQLQPLIHDPEALSIFKQGLNDPGSLDADETSRFYFFLIDLVLQGQTTMEPHSRGTLNLVDYETWIDGVAVQLNTPGGRKFWADCKVGITQTIVEALSQRLESMEGQPGPIDLLDPLLRLEASP